MRLIEDLLARSSIGRCHDFRETADVIAKVSVLLYASIVHWMKWNQGSSLKRLLKEPLYQFPQIIQYYSVSDPSKNNFPNFIVFIFFRGKI